MSAGLSAGFGRASITVFDPQLSMWGWGEAQQVPHRVVRPLHARAMALAHGGRRLVYVCCELGMISESVRHHAMARLAADGLSDHDVMITATHTHSAPSGYSTWLFYAMPGPGFSQPVHDAIVDGVVEAVRAALASLEPAKAWVHEGVVPLEEPIAFNRALRAHLRNRDVSPSLTREEAVDRNMVVLRVDAADGRPLGVVSWFGLHGTCVHGDHHVVHPDHKGEASLRLEEDATNPAFVAIFAQAAAGDVTPNHRHDRRRGKRIGRFDDDLESASFVGGVQARIAAKIAAAADREGRPVDGLGGALRFVDFFDAPVHPDHAGGRSGLHTVSPVLGFGFGLGTAEGPGPFRPARRLMPALVRLRAAIARRGALAQVRHHGGKLPFWDLGYGVAGRVSGVLRSDHPVIGLVPDDRARFYRRAVTASAARDLPWVPRWLPAQILRIGPLLVVGLPMEATTHAARRLARAVAAAAGPGARRVVINGYANAYASYLTTPEEYAVQGYEGAMTLYGQWSLGAWCTAFSALAPAACSPTAPDDVGTRPEIARDALPSGARGDVVLRHAEVLYADQPLPTRLVRFYEDLAVGRAPMLDRLGELFTEDVRFRDPFRATVGLAALRELFVRMFRRYAEVRFTGFVCTGSPDAFTLTYDMHLRMAVGPSFVVPMASVCVARDGRVAELTDFYDVMSALVSPSGRAAGAYGRVVRGLFL